MSTTVEPVFSEKRTYINFKKADWPRFYEETEAEFAKLVPPVNVYKAEKAFSAIVGNASKVCIPKGRIKKVIPNIPTEAAVKSRERDQLREADPTDPQISVLNTEIDQIIKTSREQL